LESSKADKKFRKLTALLLITFTFCPSGRSAEVGPTRGGKMPLTAEAGTYVFASDRSTVVQSGGFAGVNETHPVEGQFRLLVDFEAGNASFSQVSANLIGKSGFLPTQDLGVLFNMSALVGTFVGDSVIEFEGKTADGPKSDIVIRLTFAGDSVTLTGQTIPPAGSADFFVFNLDAVADRKYGGGTGEPDAPYLIGTADHLNAIGADPGDWDSHFKLAADIDLSGLPGAAFNIIGTSQVNPFTGEFDGDGYRISYLSHTSSGRDYVGLFGCVGWDGQIRNLQLNAAVISAEKGDYVGPLAGCLAGGLVTNCTSEGAVVSGKKYVGGLVGRNTVSSGGILEILCVGAIEQCSSAGSVSGDLDVGGLVGLNSGIINNCSSSASASGTTGVGGLVGSNNHGQGPAEIARCYSIGTVDATARAGGLAGHNNSEITDSFWDVQTSGQTSSDGGNGKTTAQMQMAHTFLEAGWDLTDEDANGTEDIWRVCEAANYPQLPWQIQPGDFVCPDGITADDFLFFTERWLDENCDTGNDYCRGADLDFSGAVDADDLTIFLDIWLASL
jgi:hypothetical protein